MIIAFILILMDRLCCSKISKKYLFPIFEEIFLGFQTTLSGFNCPYIEVTIQKLGKNNLGILRLCNNLCFVGARQVDRLIRFKCNFKLFYLTVEGRAHYYYLSVLMSKI